MTTEQVVGEYFPHPNGFILAVPKEAVSSSELESIQRRIFRKYGCLLLIQQINSKHVVRPFDGLPQTKACCCNMLRWLCEDMHISDLEFSGDLASYDTSGKIFSAITTNIKHAHGRTACQEQ